MKSGGAGVGRGAWGGALNALLLFRSFVRSCVACVLSSRVRQSRTQSRVVDVCNPFVCFTPPLA